MAAIKHINQFIFNVCTVSITEKKRASKFNKLIYFLHHTCTCLLQAILDNGIFDPWYIHVHYGQLDLESQYICMATHFSLQCTCGMQQCSNCISTCLIGFMALAFSLKDFMH